jgi:glycosyltransferase 2 family protein
MIRSSLESKIYILQGTFTSYQTGVHPAELRLRPPEGCRVTAPERPRRPGFRGPLILLGLMILLGVLALRARGAAFDWNLFWGTLQHVTWFWLAAAIVLMLLTYVGRALRWQVMLRPLGSRVSIARLASDTAIGFMAAVLLGRLGEFVRPYLISLSAGVSFSSQLATWFLERLLDLLAVLLLFGFALIRVPSHGGVIGPWLRWTLSAGGYVAAALGLTCVVLLVLFRNIGPATQDRILAAITFLPTNYYNRSKQLLDAFVRGVESTRDLGLLSLLVAYTGLEWALITGTYFYFFHAFPATRSFRITDVVILVGFISFGSIVQVPGIGGGIQITSIVVLSEMYAVPLEAASGIALFLWALTLVLIVPLGLGCAVHRGMNWNKIRQLAQDHMPEQERL